MSVLSASLLGASEFGVFGVSAALVATGGALLAVPLEDVAARRYQSESMHGGDPEGTWSIYYWADVVFGLVRLLLLLAALPLFASLYSARIVPSTAILIVAMTISTADPVIAALLNVRGRQQPIAVGRVIGPSFRLLLVLVLRPRSAIALALIQVAGSFLSSGYLIFKARAHITRPGRWARWVTESRNSRKIVAHLFTASSLRGFAGNIDQLLVGSWLGFNRAGIYRLAKSVAAAPGTVVSALRFVKAPDIREAAIGNNMDRLRRHLYRLSVVSAALGLGVLIAWLIFGKRLISLVLGPGFAEVYGIAALLIIASMLDYVTAWSKVLPVALDRGHLALIDALWYAISPIPFLAVGINLYGLAGAAFAMMFVSGCASLAWLAFVTWGLPAANVETPPDATPSSDASQVDGD